MLNPTLDLEEIRLTLCAIALAHPDVSYTLRNEMTGRNLLQTKQQSTDGAAPVFAELFGKDWTDKLAPVGSVREPCDKIKTRITFSGKQLILVTSTTNYLKVVSNIQVSISLWHSSLLCSLLHYISCIAIELMHKFNVLRLILDILCTPSL